MGTCTKITSRAHDSLFPASHMCRVRHASHMRHVSHDHMSDPWVMLNNFYFHV